VFTAGAAIFADPKSTLHIVDSQFSNVNSNIGGAIFVSSECSLFLKNVSFLSVSASSSNGGVIYLSSFSNASIYDSKFDSCSALHNGGIFFVDFNSVLTIKRSNFFNSSAGMNGGCFFLVSSATLSLADCHFMISRAYIGGVFLFSRIRVSLSVYHYLIKVLPKIMEV
jgi:hypothetical protein